MLLFFRRMVIFDRRMAKIAPNAAKKSPQRKLRGVKEYEAIFYFSLKATLGQVWFET